MTATDAPVRLPGGGFDRPQQPAPGHVLMPYGQPMVGSGLLLVTDRVLRPHPLYAAVADG